MKFNDITSTNSALAATRALRKESIEVANLGGRRLRDELQRINEEIDMLSSKGGQAYTRAILHREIYEDMAKVDAVIFEAELEEDDVEKAEVVIAARAMNNEFQSMIEDVADMLGSDMITLVDQIKARFSDAAGEAYAQTVKTALQGAIDTLTQTKDSLDGAISGLIGDVPVEPVAATPIFPSSSGPEADATGREIKSAAV